MVRQQQHGGDVFAVARRHGWDWRDVVDCSASINPLGPSPLVRPAIEEAIARIVHYPERYAESLRRALGEAWNIAPENLIAGNGATELIHWFARLNLFESVSLAAPVFSEFHAAYPDAAIVPFDAQAWPHSGLIVVTRPANPTGSMSLGLEDYLEATVNPVLIDESFIEFTGRPSLIHMVDRRPNLYILRSLTKFHAIPGLRAGVLVADAATLARLPQEPWSVNVLAEQAVKASLRDTDHAARTVAFVRQEREWLASQLSAIPGLRPMPGLANFMLVAMDRDVETLVKELEIRKVLARNCSGWPGIPVPRAMRVAVRPRSENIRLIEALRGAMCES
jgi:threonine-phosphate decarboxylase